MRVSAISVVAVCVTVGAALFHSPIATAQTPVTVSLEDVVASALERHPSIVAAARSLDAAQARLVQAKAGTSPQVAVNARASVGTISATGTPTGGGPTSSSNVSLGASLPLYDGGMTAVQVAEAEAAVDAAIASLEATRQDVALNAAQAYFQVLRTMRIVEIRESALQFAQRQVEQAEALVRAGTAARADVIKAQAVAAGADADLVAAHGQVELALASLRGAMGLPLSQAIAVAEPQDISAPAFSPAEAATEASAKRAEVQRAAADVRGAGAALRLAELRAGVTVSVAASGAVQVTPNPGQTGWSLSATLSYPVIDGGPKAVVDEAKANLAAAKARAEVISQQVQLQAFQAAVSLRETTARVAAFRASVAAAEESLRVAEGRYRAGVGILLDVLDAQAAATQARLNLVQADYDLRLAAVTLRHAVGRPVVDRRSARVPYHLDRLACDWCAAEIGAIALAMEGRLMSQVGTVRGAAA